MQDLDNINISADLDALVAAPDHHEVLLENDSIRVLDSLLTAGESTPIHTHSWPGVQYILGFSDFVRVDVTGKTVLDSLEFPSKPRPGVALWSGPLKPHSVKNVGDADLRVISVELKS